MTASKIRNKKISETTMIIFESVFLCALFGLIMWGIIAIPTKPTVDYRKTATVFAKYGTLTTVEIPDGNLYDFEDKTGEYEVGDKVVVGFNNNGSSRYIYDDIIISIERVDN